MKILTAALVLAVSCAEDTSKYARGRSLDVAELPATERARIYAAALGGAFDIGPGLSILVDSSMLNRTGGLGVGGTLGGDVRAALHETRITQGECAPQRREANRTPICSASIPGYVVRFSEVFAMSGDSVQTHVFAERYDTPSTGVHNRFTFEQAYQVVRRGGNWRVVRKARID
ncbi:MAG: hypothetical protein ACT4PJ_11960 [Gemmatimonadaceae bacterium]